MESMTHSASVAGAERAGEVTVGRNVALRYLANESVDLLKEIHVFAFGAKFCGL